MDPLTRRRAAGASSIMLLMSPAAVFSVTAADAQVAGRVVAGDGTPAAGVTVRVVQTDTGVELPLFNPTGPTRMITETLAGADGRYSSPLPGAYVPGRETDADWIVSASKPAAAGHADVRVTHGEGRTIYHQRVTSATVAPALPPLVPPSRGAPCKVAFADGRVTDDQGCPATDGNLTVPAWEAFSRPSAGGGNTTTTLARVTSVTVELRTAIDVESVFVRNCHRDCLVEVSAGGSAWARPRTTPPTGTPIDGVAVPLGTGDRRPVGVIVAAAILLGAVGAGAAVLAVTRPRRPVT